MGICIDYTGVLACLEVEALQICRNIEFLINMINRETTVNKYSKFENNLNWNLIIDRGYQNIFYCLLLTKG